MNRDGVNADDEGVLDDAVLDDGVLEDSVLDDAVGGALLTAPWPVVLVHGTRTSRSQ